LLTECRVRARSKAVPTALKHSIKQLTLAAKSAFILDLFRTVKKIKPDAMAWFIGGQNGN
jgi:hypothetical protein